MSPLEQFLKEENLKAVENYNRLCKKLDEAYDALKAIDDLGRRGAGGAKVYTLKDAQAITTEVLKKFVNWKD